MSLYIGTAAFPADRSSAKPADVELRLRKDLPAAPEFDPIPVAEARELGAWPGDVAVPAFQESALDNAFWRAQDRRFKGTVLTGWGSL